MPEEEKKAMEILKEITTDDLLNCWEGEEKEYNAIQTVLNLIQSQQKEIEKKDKIIDEMAKEINSKTIKKEDWCLLLNKQGCFGNNTCLKCLKQYFEKKVEGK